MGAQLPIFERLLSAASNVIISINDYDPDSYVETTHDRIIILWNHGSRSKSDNIRAGAESRHCFPYALVYDFNEYPNLDLIDRLTFTGDLVRGAKVYSPQRSNISNYLFMKTCFDQLALLPALYRFGGLYPVLGSNFVARQDYILHMFADNPYISEDVVATCRCLDLNLYPEYRPSAVLLEAPPPTLKAWARQQARWSHGIAEAFFHLFFSRSASVGTRLFLFFLAAHQFFYTVFFANVGISIMLGQYTLPLIALAVLFAIKVVELGAALAFSRCWLRKHDLMCDETSLVVQMPAFIVLEIVKIGVRVFANLTFLLGLRYKGPTERA